MKKAFGILDVAEKKAQPVVVEVVQPSNAKEVAFSSPAQNASTRVAAHSLLGKGVTYLSCDEKDVFVNPWNLSNDLDLVDTPSLSSQSPVCVNFAADGFPRIEGKPWNGGKPSTGSEHAPEYDPTNPRTLVSFGMIVNEEGRQDLTVLGFRVRFRIFDTELGTSTAGIRVFAKDFDHEVINAMIAIDTNDAEVVIPFFEQNVTVATAGAGDWNQVKNTDTLRFLTKSSKRDSSYNLVISEPSEETSSIASIPSFFTLTGYNVYCYVSPILATDKATSDLLATLRTNPAAYLETLINC